MVVILLGYMYWDVELSPAASTTKTAGSGLEKTLVLGTDPGFKPFEYKQGQEIVGFDIDLVREIAKDTNRSLQIEEIAFDGSCRHLAGWANRPHCSWYDCHARSA